MILVVGLGNPGEKYAGHRHNIGFMAAEHILRRYAFSALSAKFNAKVATGTVAGTKVVLLLPQTFMNLSGTAVQAAAAFYKIPVENIVVLHDELDVAFTKIKIKQGGGHAGHNGLRSIEQALGANFKRIRMGIGHPGEKSKVHGYVLSDFTKTEQPLVHTMCAAVAAVLPQVIAGDDARAASDFALIMQEPIPE